MNKPVFSVSFSLSYFLGCRHYAVHLQLSLHTSSSIISPCQACIYEKSLLLLFYTEDCSVLSNQSHWMLCLGFSAGVNSPPKESRFFLQNKKKKTVFLVKKKKKKTHQKTLKHKTISQSSFSVTHGWGALSKGIIRSCWFEQNRDQSKMEKEEISVFPAAIPHPSLKIPHKQGQKGLKEIT